MPMTQLSHLLGANSYPGRGILIGRSADGARMMLAYFIMGRSENSRNRVFVADGDGLRTQAFDPAKLGDPSLVIYAPVRVLGADTIVTNGDQTDTVFEALKTGGTFEEALRTRTFEPDPPILTPRISGIVQGASYKLSILKSAEGDARGTRRQFFEYTAALPGQGHLIHTYRCDGDPVPSFEGEPVCVELGSDLDALTATLWESLNAQNRVSLFTRTIDLATGETASRIVNQNK